MNFAPELKTHAQKVCSLYKKGLRLIEGWYVYRPQIRYQQVLLRDKFDSKKDEKDPKEQRRLLWVGEYEIFMKQNPCHPAKFANSYGLAGGVAAERDVPSPDWVLDYWHPLEKARYPHYFKKRELAKKEFIKKWNANEIL